VSGVHKDAQDLADRVNAVGDGWEAELARGGSHAGRAFIVSHRGSYVSRISGHASVLSLALERAEAELRRRGCPLPRKSITKKKEDRMAAPTAAEREASDKLRPRLREAVSTADGSQYDFVKRAVEIIEESPLEQFGGGVAKSTPQEIAASTLSRFLDGGAFKQTNIERFEYVLDRLNGAAPETAPALGLLSPAEADLEELRQQLADERGLRTLAEDTVAEVERERDAARDLSEKREEARLSLVQRVDELAGKATELEQELERRPEGDEELSRKVADQQASLDEIGDELEAARLQVEELDRKLAEATAELDGRRAIEELRKRYADTLLNCIADADAPTGWALDRLDRLTGIGGDR
jgi:DNA repair exonuclease SbcCD ATPase subunit